ncbi:MAG: tetratricopeptide repeat protein [Anaerolineaceae bacterium]
MTPSIPVTHTKIIVPRRRTELLSRKRLLDLLNGFMDTKLAIIAAPAGYGKTSLLIDFAQQSRIPTCWYSIDSLDQEIIRFLTHFISAINKRFPVFGKESLSAVVDKNDVDINVEAVCTTIVNDLFEHILEHFVIILDDYHLLGSNQKVEQFISHFIHAVDENCHLIIASRALLTLPDLPLLVAQSQVSGLSYEELTFTAEEVQSLFLQNYQLDLPPDAIDNLIAQTEGWITGLVLATQMYGQETSRLARIKRVTGVSLYEYLSEQVLLKQPDQIKIFLLYSSLLEEFDTQLCREILDGCLGEPNPDWSELVSYTLHNSLFALPVGDETISIRYHHLFRDFLQARALAENPNECKTIRLRLANHHKKNKAWVRAHRLYKQMGDNESIVAMLMEDGSEILASGNLQSLTEWLGELSEDTLLQYPELLSLLGSVRVMRGQVEAGLACHDKAIPLLLDGKNKRLLIRTLLRRSDAYRLLGKYDSAIQDASQALSLCGNSKKPSSSHAEALRALGISNYHLGALVKSKTFLNKSLLIYQKLDDTHNIAMLSMEMGLLSANMGEYEPAKEYYLKASNLWSKTSNLVWQANLTNNLGVLYHQMGDFTDAISTLECAYGYANQTGYPRMEAFSLTSIGDIYHDLGAIVEAEQAYQKAAIINDQIKDRYLTIYLGLAEAKLALGLPDYEKAKLSGCRALEQALKDSSDLEIALARTWYGHYLICVNNPREAINTLRSALEIYDRERDRSNSALTRFYLSVALYQVGELKAASKDLSLALHTSQTVNDWNNLLAPAQHLIHILRKMADTADLNSASTRLLTSVAKFEALLPGLRRHIRQHTRIVSFGPPRLSIRSLGSMQVKINNKTVTNKMWQTVLSRDLFFLILQHPGGVTKEAVGLVFWPDADPDDIKIRFKNAIYRLRRAIGKEVILFEDDRYFFNYSVDYEYDADIFKHELAMAQGEHPKPDRIAHLNNAIQAYKGPFLPGLDHIEIVVERERLQRLFENACIEEAEMALSQGDYQESVNLCLRAIEQEPYLEAAYQVIFKAYAASGNKTAVIKLYTQLEQILHKELSTKPSPETIKIYREII